MVFSSTVFLLWFLPLTAGLYFLCPRRYRNAVLLAASLLFYGWGEPKYVCIMLFSTVFDYCNGRAIEHFRKKDSARGAKAVLWISVVGNLGILFFFKYTDFAIENVNSLLRVGLPALGLSLPIGFSFYTFQTMSYTIDVYRGQIPAQHDMLDFATYVTLFPQLIAGPIVQYKTVAGELHRRQENWQDASEGLQRFVVGLAKKVLIANQTGALWEEIRAMAAPSVLTAWLGAMAFGLQIYFDFSGYSDMAIGLGRLFGFHFLENFNYPYTARSVTDFWRRWHISLTTWFKEYVYFPLGGNRCGRARQLFNIAAVWLLTGFWHGASWNFLLWGALSAAMLLLEKLFLGRLLARLPGWVGHLYTLFFCFVSMTVFAITELPALGRYLAAMFAGPLWDGTALYLLGSRGVLLLLAAVGCTQKPRRAYEALHARLGDAGKGALSAVLVTVLLLLSVAFLVGDSYNPFLYFRF